MMLFSRFSMDETELRFENLGAGEVVMAYHKALTPYKIPIGAYNKDISVTRKESATSHSCLPLLGRSDYAPISAGAVIIARTFPPPNWEGTTVLGSVHPQREGATRPRPACFPSQGRSSPSSYLPFSSNNMSTTCGVPSATGLGPE